MSCCAVILAGGLSTRMGGKNKGFLRVGEQTILERLVGTLRGLFREILLVTRQPQRYGELDVTVVPDLFAQRSSLTGIHAGLAHAKTPYIFVVGCDTPFLQPALVQALLAALEPAVDVLVPVREGRYEPLCAIYSKRCLPHIEAQLARDDFKIVHLYPQVTVKILDPEALRRADSRHLSFFNVNTPEALDASQAMLQRLALDRLGVVPERTP